MRLLAKELRISVITTKRAYEELERDGFICSQVGKGSFVADTNHELVRGAVKGNRRFIGKSCRKKQDQWSRTGRIDRDA